MPFTTMYAGTESVSEWNAGITSYYGPSVCGDVEDFRGRHRRVGGQDEKV